MTAPVLLEVADGVAVVTLNRPDCANAIDVALARALHDALEAVRCDTTVRAAVLRGEGAIFCAGGDVREMAAADDRSAYMETLVSAAHRAARALAAVDVPVVAAVQGAAAGAGLGLAAACDVVVAGRSARFLAAFGAVGLTPDTGTSWYLPRVVGVRRALDLLVNGRRLSAEEALAWGLVTAVVDDGDVHGEALATARRMARTPALGEAFRLVRAGVERPLDEHLDDELATMVRAAGTDDAARSIAAFLDRKG